MSALRCNVVVGPGAAGRRWFDNEKLVHVLLESGEHVERRRGLGYQPPFLQLVPCPYCSVEDDRNHDLSKHVNTHLITTEGP